jgi:hypothetical protein
VPTLQFCFLGALNIRQDGQPLPTPPTLKSQSLLAYLVLHRPQPRGQIIGTLILPTATFIMAVAGEAYVSALMDRLIR